MWFECCAITHEDPQKEDDDEKARIQDESQEIKGTNLARDGG